MKRTPKREDRMKNTKIALLVLILAAATAVAIIGPGISSVSASAQETETEIEDFIPSEELSPDSAVAFPVDI